MNRTIKLTKKPVGSVGPRKIRIVKALTNLGATKEPVEFTQLKKSCRSVDPKVLRAHIRELQEMKVVSIRRAA